uniref:Sugar transferase n=1 Tax=Roseihalotalea indica TaxID=2867963 RepID=A0AA49JHT2_9BACT|nr:sugar transferase [Tunicatimonas sp. TK19036]
MKYQIAKRWFDGIIALSALMIMSPFIGFVLVLLRVFTREYPIFIQPRVGYQEQVFLLYKIKTMYSPEVYMKVSWIKKLCLWLRQYSVDEVLQFWNVLKGDMSLIGPRPLLVEYLPLYNEDQKKRHTVKPGMSGWAQLQGRNRIPWPQRFALDIWYVEHRSFWLDLKILRGTLLHLLHPEGVRPEGLSASEKFGGNDLN